MVDDDLQTRLDAIILLLGIIVSLLAGVVLGSGSGATRFYALASFVVLGAVLVMAGVGHDRS